MFDPASMILSALVIGAVFVAQSVGELEVQNAYKQLKTSVVKFIVKKYQGNQNIQKQVQQQIETEIKTFETIANSSRLEHSNALPKLDNALPNLNREIVPINNTINENRELPTDLKDILNQAKVINEAYKDKLTNEQDLSKQGKHNEVSAVRLAKEATGLDIKNISAANLRLNHILSGTGVRAESLNLGGDIVIDTVGEGGGSDEKK